MVSGNGKAELKKGFARVANEILVELASLDLCGESLRIALFVIRVTYGNKGQKWSKPIGYSYFAQSLKMHRSNVARAVKDLEARNIISVDRTGFRNKYKFNNVYRKWNDPQYEFEL